MHWRQAAFARQRRKLNLGGVGKYSSLWAGGCNGPIHTAGMHALWGDRWETSPAGKAPTLRINNSC